MLKIVTCVAVIAVTVLLSISLYKLDKKKGGSSGSLKKNNKPLNKPGPRPGPNPEPQSSCATGGLPGTRSCSPDIGATPGMCCEVSECTQGGPIQKYAGLRNCDSGDGRYKMKSVETPGGCVCVYDSPDTCLGNPSPAQQVCEQVGGDMKSCMKSLGCH